MTQIYKMASYSNTSENVRRCQTNFNLYLVLMYNSSCVSKMLLVLNSLVFMALFWIYRYQIFLSAIFRVCRLKYCCFVSVLRMTNVFFLCRNWIFFVLPNYQVMAGLYVRTSLNVSFTDVEYKRWKFVKSVLCEIMYGSIENNILFWAWSLIN